MNQIWHALGFAALAILSAGLLVLCVLAWLASEVSEPRLIANLTLRRVLWGIACFFWTCEVVSLFLNLLSKASPGNPYAATVFGAIVISGFITIRGMWATRQRRRRSPEA